MKFARRRRHAALPWLVSDAVRVPLIRFSKPPGAYPASVHLESPATHGVYGAATAEAQSFLRARVRGPRAVWLRG